MVIFLYGGDWFRSSRKVVELKQKYFESDKSGSGLSLFDAEEDGDISQKIKEACLISNLFSSKRLVIVKNVILESSAEEQKKLHKFLGENMKRMEKDKDLVAVFWERGVPKKNNSLWKILEKSSKKQEFEKLAGAKLNAWVLKRMKELDPKAEISKKALEKLISFAGGETLILNNEIGKLVNFANGRMISERDVETMVRSSVDGNIFATVDALGANNKKDALRLLHNHLEKGDDPFYLMSMFVYQFRNLLKVADLREIRNMGEYEIAKSAKMHSFVVKKSLSQLRNFSFERIKKIYGELLEIDVKVKTGKIDIKVALDKFVAEL